MAWLRKYTTAKPSFSEACEYWRSLPDDRTELVKGPGLAKDGEWIPRNTFPGYWTQDLWQAIELWRKWNDPRYGLPLNLSWAEHPAVIIDTLDIVDAVVKEHSDASRR